MVKKIISEKQKGALMDAFFISHFVRKTLPYKGLKRKVIYVQKL